MKKKDIIEEEEILDEEEILEDEDEILDDDDEILEEEEEVDEKPKKKAKATKEAKAGKKKLGKGAKAGIIIGSVVAVLVIIAIVFVTLILPMITGAPTIEGAGSYTATIGAEECEVATNTPVNEDMKAGEMLLIAVDNYYKADFAANIMVIGGVNTTVAGIPVPQGVQSFKVRYGKGNATDSSNVTENAKYFAYSKSVGVATMCEEYYAIGPSVKYRSIPKEGDDRVKKMSKKITTANGKEQKVSFAAGAKWDTTKSYSSINAFYEATSTDFTKLWSYKVDTTTILNYNDKIGTSDDGKYYYFTIKLDLKKATADYYEVMKYQLQGNMGMNVDKLDFTRLELECAVYPNGSFKYIIVHEAYKMNVSGVPVVGSLDGMEIANNCINEYSFDPNEELPYWQINSKGKVEEVPFDFNTVIANF